MRLSIAVCLAAVTAAVTAGSAGAQSAAEQPVGDRVLAAPADVVRLSFAAREDLCGDRRGALGGGAGGNWQRGCEDGPVRVQIEKAGGRIVALRSYVGGSWRPRAETGDLGEVDAADASAWLLDVAADAPAAAAAEAVTAAVLADAPDPWQRLLALGRDATLANRVRERAIFWLGQSAAEQATRGLAGIVDGDEHTRVQKAAVFALSQRDEPARVDQLVRVARTHSNPEVVKAAFFWLADSTDPRALALFEDVLLGAAGGDK